MRFGLVSLLLVLGSTGLAGCGGGGSLTPSDSHPHESTYDPVPSIDALPASINPSTYTPPPSSYDVPPGQINAGGVGTGATIDSVCAELCSDVLGLACPVAAPAASDPGNGRNDQDAGPPPPMTTSTTIVSPAACTSACIDTGAKLPCVDAFASAFACILEHVPLSCDLLNDFSNQDQLKQQLGTLCQTSLVDYAACLDGSSAPPADACTSNSCGRCPDECSRCLCRNDGDSTNCTMMCQ